MSAEMVSMVIPCFNEDQTIEEFYRRATAFASSLKHYEFEFIFVNDGSTDRTPSILNNLAERDGRIKVLHLAQNRGHQIALTAGLDFTTGKIIVSMDADLQDPPELISEMLEKIREGYDVVHMQRRNRPGETLFKTLSARLFYKLLGIFSDTPIIDNCGDFRACTRPVLETIYGFRSHHRYLRGLFAQIGFRQCTLQYDRDRRYAGITKYPLLKMINLSLDAVLGFSAMPIRAISIVSILLWVCSLIYLFKALIEHFFLKITVPGWTSLIVLITFFTGLILFSIAVIGSYIGRIFIQSQNPPLYWLSDAKNFDLDFLIERAGELSEIRIAQRTLAERKT